MEVLGMTLPTNGDALDLSTDLGHATGRAIWALRMGVPTRPVDGTNLTARVEYDLICTYDDADQGDGWYSVAEVLVEGMEPDEPPVFRSSLPPTYRAPVHIRISWHDKQWYVQTRVPPSRINCVCLHDRFSFRLQPCRS